ncbi:hypothetical protein MH1LPH_03640 [Lactiplantibacillus brownii]
MSDFNKYSGYDALTKNCLGNWYSLLILKSSLTEPQFSIDTVPVDDPQIPAYCLEPALLGLNLT